MVLLPSWEAVSLAYYYDPEVFRDPTRTMVRLAADGVCSVNTPQELAGLDLAGTSEVSLLVGAPLDAEVASRELVRRGFEVVERRSFDGVAAVRFAPPEPATR